MTDFSVRLARLDEIGELRAIELAAGVLFREIGMVEVAEHPPPAVEVFEKFQRDGRAWVLADTGDRAIGFVLVELIDGAAHIEQVSVHPDHGRRGLGRVLIDHVQTWATEQELAAVTLTTFRSVAWNGPYYARLGFRELAAAEITPGLAAIQAAETAFGLDPADRIVMRRETSGVTG